MIEEIKDQIRAEGRSATPFRIGMVVGEQGLSIACPYKPGSRGESSFKQGKALGQKFAKEQP